VAVKNGTTLEKTKHSLLYDPAIALSGFYFRETKMCTHIQFLIAVLLVTGKKLESTKMSLHR
jgi:hypothetical protein